MPIWKLRRQNGCCKKVQIKYARITYQFIRDKFGNLGDINMIVTAEHEQSENGSGAERTSVTGQLADDAGNRK